MSNIKWEYKIEYVPQGINIDGPKSFTDSLNSSGENGWELVCLIHNAYLVLKRQCKAEMQTVEIK